MKLLRDFKELLAEFAGEGVRYLLVGGYAVGAHSRPRSTKDLDLWIADDEANLARASRALEKFGAAPQAIEALRDADADDVIWFGVPPGRVDILRRLSAVDFETAYVRRVETEWEGVAVSLIGRDDLIANKRAVGRPQDRRDVKELERAKTAKPLKPGGSPRRSPRSKR